MPQKSTAYRFGPFTLDTATRQLLRGDQPVKLYPKEFDTLVALVERGGQVVEKDELLRRVWPDAAVEEGNLTTHVSHLRKVLGGEHRDYIVTLPGRGYQFVAPVSHAGEAVAEPPSRGRSPRTRLVAAGVTVLVVVAAIMLAMRSRSEPHPSFRQLTFQRGTIWSARFSPDAETIVYGAAWGGAPIALFSTTPRSPESRALGHSADLLSVSSAGELAVSIGRQFARNWESSGVLARVPLEGGAPRELLHDVHDADWAGDSELAVIRRAGSRHVLEFPLGTVLYDVQGFIMRPRVSRSNDAVALLQRRSGDESVELIERSGSRRTLAAGLAGVTGLAWSPSATEVLFTMVGGGSTELHAVTLAGRRRLVMQTGGEWTLNDVARDGRALMTQHHVRGHTIASLDGDANERDLSWLDRSAAVALSDDGRILVLAELGAGGGVERAVYVRKLDGSQAVRLGDGEPAALSPDGRWVVAKQGAAPERLVLLPTGPGTPKTLPNGPLADYYTVRWLPDNRHLVFGAIEPGRERRIYRQDIAGGDPTPVGWRGLLGSMVFLPDGKTYLARIARTYHVSGLDGRDLRPLPDLSMKDYVIQAAPDGKSVFVVTGEVGSRRLDRMDLATGQRVRLKEVVIQDTAGVMHIGPEYPPMLVTPDGRTYVYSYLRILSTLYLVDRLE